MLKDNIRRMRTALKLTQKQIADTLGIDRSTFTYYETGKSNPSIETILQIAKIFNVSIDELVSHSTKPYCTDGAGDEALPNDFTALIANERNLLVRFRQLTDDDQKKIFEDLDGMLNV